MTLHPIVLFLQAGQCPPFRHHRHHLLQSLLSSFLFRFGLFDDHLVIMFDLQRAPVQPTMETVRFYIHQTSASPP